MGLLDESKSKGIQGVKTSNREPLTAWFYGDLQRLDPPMEGRRVREESDVKHGATQGVSMQYVRHSKILVLDVDWT